MNVDDVCRIRRIRSVSEETPLIIPSFSSTITIDINQVYNTLRDYIVEVSLVSAYDVYHGYINKNDIGSSLMFIDSGNYEADYLKNSKLLREWDYEKYLEILDDLPELSRYVIVNYDRKLSLSEQITRAKELFSSYSNYGACLLLKPISERDNFLHITSIIDSINEFHDFDILGLTEKELGGSLLDRCKNILRIREALQEADLFTPIHIFGCLDPLSIVAYFLCGADIFDGLSWLKYTFIENVALYFNNHAIINGTWSQSDAIVRLRSSTGNINQLQSLTSYLKHFIRTKDFETLRLRKDILVEIISLTGTAGIDFG